MPINVERKGNVTVSQQLLYYFHVDAHRHQDRGRAVPKVVEADGWEPRLLEHLLEHSVEMRRVEILPACITKHQVVLVPGLPCFGPLCALAQAVLLQGFDHYRREQYLAPAARCLGF
jgi:hypothetical protein